MMSSLKSKQAVKRSLLYYPTIIVPSSSWLRRAVLYSDEVSSIVPQQVDCTNSSPFTSDILFLRDEGEYRPIRPETLEMNWKQAQVFEEELHELVKPKLLKRNLGKRKTWQLDARIHSDKVSQRVFEFLLDEGLVRKEPLVEDGMLWYLFEENTAALYMSLLAKHLASLDNQAVTPSTDMKALQDSIFLAKREEPAVDGIEFLFKNMVPVPRSNVPLRKIVDFKKRRRDELLRFRELIDTFQSDFSKVKEKSEVRGLKVRFAEQIERGVKELVQTMQDSAWGIGMSSLRALVSASSATFWSTLGVLAGKATKVAELPIEWTLPGLVGMGLVEVSHNLLKERNDRRAKLRNSPYSYLYHARKLA
jgi:hypothetical protein